MITFCVRDDNFWLINNADVFLQSGNKLIHQPSIEHVVDVFVLSPRSATPPVNLGAAKTVNTRGEATFPCGEK